MTIEAIKNWFQLAVPSPGSRNRDVQVGVHMEEVSEMLHCLSLFDAADAAELTADTLKNGTARLPTLNHKGRIELLDALCDQIVTAIGVAHMYGLDIEGGLSEVNRSNWSKFTNGVPLFSDNGKIRKGPDYSEPQLRTFV